MPNIAPERYVGAPYEQPFGCFMLVRRVLGDQGITIPDYTHKEVRTKESQIHLSSPEGRALTLIKYLHMHAREVPSPQRQEGDVILIRRGRFAGHIGIYFERDGGVMLHTLDDTGAVLERLDSIRWRNRILGYWRVSRG